MTFDPSNSKKGDSSRFASALIEVLEAADASPRSVEQLGDAIASEAMRLLLDRNHARHRWENQPAVGVRLEDLDR